MKRSHCTLPVAQVVIYSLCALIWTSLALARWREEPSFIVVGVVWLIAAAVQWARVCRMKKKEELEHE